MWLCVIVFCRVFFFFFFLLIFWCILYTHYYTGLYPLLLGAFYSIFYLPSIIKILLSDSNFISWNVSSRIKKKKKKKKNTVNISKQHRSWDIIMDRPKKFIHCNQKKSSSAMGNHGPNADPWCISVKIHTILKPRQGWSGILSHR